MTQQASREKPGRIKRLLDKYRSLTLVTALLLITFGLSAQQIYPLIGVRQEINAKGYDWKEGSFKVLRLPSDTLTLKVTDSGSVAFKGNLWIWNGYRWKSACSCSADTSTPVTPPFSFLTQPTNQTASVGATVSFYIQVQNGVGPYKYQIHNLRTSSTSTTSTETLDHYTFSPTASETENYNFTAIDIGGNDTILSNTVTLTVAAALNFTYGYSSTDPFVNSSTAPTISNPTTTSIASGANITFSLPIAAIDKYWLVRELASQPVKITWEHNTDNYGAIPGDVVRTWTVGIYRYYSSVSEFVLTYTDPIQLKQ